MSVIIDTLREGYDVTQSHGTMTVEELIEFLQDFNADDKIYLSFDRGYTYGGLRYEMFREEE